MTHPQHLIFKALAGGVLVSLLSACAVGPAYERPDIAQPERFRNALGQEQATPKAWWRQFNDPQLEHLVETALASNQDLAQAMARVDQARAWSQRTKADQLPVVDISAQAARRHDSLESSAGRVSRDSPAFERNYNNYETGVGATWELDLFGRLRRQSEAALARYDQATAEWRGVQIAIAAETADAWLLLVQSDQQRKLLLRQIDNQRVAVELDQQRFDAHVIGIAELRGTQASLASLQAELPGLEQLIEVQHNRLAVLVGQNPSEFELPKRPDRLPEAAPILGFEQPGALLRSRPDVIAAEQRLIAGNAQVGSAMTGYYPSLSLTGVVGLQSTTGGVFSSADSVGAAGLIGLRWRLFDFARVNAEVEQAKGQRAEALAAYRQALLRATEDVENSLVTYQATREEVAQRLIGVERLASANEAVQASWQARQVSRLSAISVEQQWLSSRRVALGSEGNTVRAQVRLYKAAGKV